MANVWNRYANTRAQARQARTGRQPKSLTLDMHAHVAVPHVAEIVTPHLQAIHRSARCKLDPETQALMANRPPTSARA